eukprot:gene6675-8257_t
MSEKSSDTWKNIKTGFARTKHKVLAKVGAAETTVDTKINAESEKLFTLFKLMKRLNKNVEKYEDILKNIIVLQNEVAHDLLALDEKDPSMLAYQESQRALEAERMRIQDYIQTYYHDPLRQYLAQFREIRARLAELDTRRLDMDRYYRDYSIKANKGKDASSLSKTENKHTRTKEAYQELSDELMRDMQSLYEDRQAVFDPALATFVNRHSEFFEGSSQALKKAVPYVQSIDEYGGLTHPWVITPNETSAASKNVRSSSVFTSKEYSSPSSTSPNSPTTQRPRASTIATTTVTSPPLQPYSPQPYQPPATQQSYQPPPATQQSYQPPQQQSYQPPQQQSYQPPQQQSYQPPQHAFTLNKTPQPPSATAPPANLNKSPTLGPNPSAGLNKPFNNENGSVPPPQSQILKPRAKSVYLGNGTGPIGGSGSGRALPTPGGGAGSGRALPTPQKKGEALYDFEGLDSTELSFKKGDIITFTKTTGEWFEGELNGKRGLVPCNYVELK